MRTHLLFKAAIVALILSACSSEENLTKTDDSGRNAKANTQSALAALQRAANQKLTQKFTFNAGQERVTIKTKAGVLMSFDATKFTINGAPVQGVVNVEYKEIFKTGNMVTANKTTMGVAQDVEQIPEDLQLRPLSTGGEFFVNMTNEQGKNLDNGNPITLTVPTALTDDNGGDTGGMTVWDGKVEDTNGDGVPEVEGDVTWNEKEDQQGNNTLVPVQNGNYIMGITQFGWSNIDVLRSDPGPKTTIFVQVPPAYNSSNSNCYLAYQNASNSIAPMDMFDPATNKFTEHYGQVPLGMNCYIIFVSAQGSTWKYAIKPVVISAPGQYSISNTDIVNGTEASVVAAINALP